MKSPLDPRLDQNRVIYGQFATNMGTWVGAYRIFCWRTRKDLLVIASRILTERYGVIEHVMVSRSKARKPLSMEEIHFITEIFFQPGERVVILPQSEDPVGRPNISHLWHFEYGFDTDIKADWINQGNLAFFA